MPTSVSFVKRRGWVEKKRAWESRLDPSTVDRANFQRYLDTVSGSGFQITSLKEELAKGPDRVRRVYELVQDVWEDVPLPVPYTKVPYEQWEARDFKNPLFMRDGFFIASRATAMLVSVAL